MYIYQIKDKKLRVWEWAEGGTGGIGCKRERGNENDESLKNSK